MLENSPVNDQANKQANTLSDTLDDKTYLTKIRSTLDRLEAEVETWCNERDIDVDLFRDGMVLTVDLARFGKIILNAQPPLHELWLASKFGGYHYQWREADWFDAKHQEFFQARFWGDLARQVA